MLKRINCLNSLERKQNRYLCQNFGRNSSLEEGILIFLNKKQQKQHFTRNSFKKLYQNEKSIFWFRVRNIIIVKIVLNYLPFQSRLIELGCGSGFVSKHLGKIGYQVERADLYSEGLKYCQKKDAGRAYYQFNPYDPLFLEEFYGICAFDVLEHVADDNLVLKNMHKSLSPGGLLFLIVPACKKLWFTIDKFAEHKRRYSTNESSEKIELTSFKALKLSYFIIFLFPFIVFSRMLSNFLLYRKPENLNPKAHTFREIQINPNLNSYFYSIFRIEAQFIPYRDLTFDSSLLLCAIKRRD